MRQQESVSEGDQDRLSNLPDSLIHHVFSFIDSLYLVRASSLAHRWRHLYTSTPTLSLSFENIDYDDRPQPQPQPRHGLFGWFSGQLTPPPPPRRSPYTNHGPYYYSYCSKVIFEPGKIEALLSAALEHGGLQFLELSTDFDTFRLPTCLSTSRSLKELMLRSTAINLPKDTGFPLLKKLHLEHGHPLGGELDGSIISRCPNLEILTLKNCNISDISKTLHISAPNLRSLVISNARYFPFPRKDWEYVIMAPRLARFSFTGSRALNCHLSPPCSLDEVKIHVFETTYNRTEKAYGLLAMLKVFESATTIMLSHATHKYLSEAGDLFQVANSSSNYKIFCHSEPECINKLGNHARRFRHQNLLASYAGTRCRPFGWVYGNKKLVYENNIWLWV